VCLEVRARDKVGRQTPWTGRMCRAQSIDAARLATGPQWRTVSRDGWQAGTATVSSRRGASLTVPSSGGVGLVRVVALTGPGMGRLRIDVGNQMRASISLDRRQRGLQEFLLLTPQLSGQVKATVVSSGRQVWVDSIGVVRRPAP
jgi:hypothetical protein